MRVADEDDLRVVEYKDFGRGWLDNAGTLPVCLVQSPQPALAGPAEAPWRTIASVLDGSGVVARALGDDDPLFIVAPEYALQLEEVGSLEKLLRELERPWAVQVGLRPATGAALTAWTRRAPEGIRRAAGWRGALGETAEYVSGVLMRREASGEVNAVMFLKNHFALDVERHAHGDLRTGKDILRVDIPGELTLFPLICADLTQDDDGGPRMRIRKHLQRPEGRAEGNRALVAASLYESNPASGHWDQNITRLLDHAPTELRLLLVNHASGEGSHRSNGARNRTGFYGERKEISEHVEAGAWRPWSREVARGWTLRRTGPVLFLTELAWDASVRETYPVRHQRLFRLQADGALRDELPQTPLTHEGAYARHGLRRTNRWHPAADPAWKRSRFRMAPTEPGEHVRALLHGISAAPKEGVDTPTLDHRWEDFRRGLRVLAHLAAAEDIDWDVPTFERPGQLKGPEGLSILVWCGGAATALDAQNQLLRWSSMAAPEGPVLIVGKPVEGGFEHAWRQVVALRGHDTRATPPPPPAERRIGRPRPHPVYTLALEAVENVLNAAEDPHATLQSRLGTLLRPGVRPRRTRRNSDDGR